MSAEARPFIEILVLAAGRGSRMGMVKALVKVRERTFLSYVSDFVAKARAALDIESSVHVVVGAAASEVKLEARALNLETIENPQFASGLMSSLQTGVREILQLECLQQKQCLGALVVLADQPLLEAPTLVQIIQAFLNHRVQGLSLIRPTFNGELGNPCFIGRQHFDEILGQAPQDRGAVFLFNKYPEKVLLQPVEDHGVLLDFDHPREIPSRSEHA